MAWFKKEKSTESAPPPRSKGSEGMWLKCNHCREIVYRKEVDRNSKVCPKCEYHFPISVYERIALLIDFGTFKEWDANLSPRSADLTDTKSYRDRIKPSKKKPAGRMPLSSAKARSTAGVRSLCFRFRIYGRQYGVGGGRKVLPRDRSGVGTANCPSSW